MSTNFNTLVDNDINAFSPDPQEPELDLGGWDPKASDRQFAAEPRPGVHEFTFSLQTGEGYEHQPFEFVEKKANGEVVGKTLLVNYKLSYTFTKQSGETAERTVNFLRADFYQTPNMKAKNVNSEGTKLLAALNGAPEKFTADNIKAEFEAAAMRGQKLRCKTGLRLYDKETKIEYTTNLPKRPKDNQVAWPKNEKGEWELFIPLASGERKSGNVSIVEFYRIK